MQASIAAGPVSPEVAPKTIAVFFWVCRVLLKKAAGLDKASGEPNRNKVAKLPVAKVQEIAEMKMADLNCNDIEAAIKIISGTARSMGIEIRE